MDGTASESVRPQPQSSAPSSRRFSMARATAESIEKLLLFWSRLGKKEPDVSRVDEQLTALRGYRDIGSEVILAVVPKPNFISLRDLLKDARLAMKGIGVVRDLTYGCVGPRSLVVTDERTELFCRYTESVPGDVLVIPLEICLTQKSDDALQSHVMKFRRGEFLVDPCIFGVALLSGQLDGWKGVARFPAIRVSSRGRFRRGIPMWSRTDDEYQFQVRDTQYSGSSEPYVVGFAPEEVLIRM